MAISLSLMAEGSASCQGRTEDERMLDDRQSTMYLAGLSGGLDFYDLVHTVLCGPLDNRIDNQLT